MATFALLLARFRLWVLAAAALMGLAAAGGLSPAPAGQPPVSMAADIVDEAIPAARAAAIEVVVAANESGEPGGETAETPPAAQDAAPGAGKPAKRAKPSASAGITIDDDTGKVRIHGGGESREYDSFEAFVERAPWIAAMVFGVTFLVFLTPVVIIALVIWYKMRKARMHNETMVRLAEKGVVPPAEAFDAVVAGPAPPATTGQAASPLYERARAARVKAAWSDLRKGVICGAVGLGFTFYSMLEDGEANFVGLVLMFVGLAYIVLWYFEDRQTVEPGRGPPPSA